MTALESCNPSTVEILNPALCQVIIYQATVISNNRTMNSSFYAKQILKLDTTTTHTLSETRQMQNYMGMLRLGIDLLPPLKINISRIIVQSQK